MKLFPYSPTTGAYAGFSVEADVCQFTGEPLFTSFATDVEPPTAEPGHVAVFLDAKGGVPIDHASGTWFVKVDRRGLTYWLADGTEHTITAVGVEPPEGYLSTRPTVLTLAQQRAVLLSDLASIDGKKVRALTDFVLTNDSTRLRALEEQAVAVRAQLANLPSQ